MLRQAFKDLGRLREISLVAIRHGFGGMVNRTKVAELFGKQQETDDQTGRSPAERFRLMLTELGPTFVKLGQTLSARPDILPRDYVEELSKLQDNVPPESLEHVLGQLLESFGRPADALFAHIEPRPLASASIAQVHRARLHTGEEVVVKIQRPGIVERVRADLDLLQAAASLLEAVFEETGAYSPKEMIAEFETAIYEELDFFHEADNLKEFHGRNLSRDEILIPRVYPELTSQTVLTMEFLDGVRIRSIDPSRHDFKKLANRLIECSFRQIFTDGLFHADPHPGNILVMEGDRIGLLDFGAVGRLTKQMQENLIQLVVAVSLHDADTVARLLYRVATPDRRTDLAAFSADIRDALDRYMSRSTTLGSIDAKQLIPEMLTLAIKYHIKIPREYALLSRAALSVEGLLRWLDPDVKIADAVMPYARELLLGQFGIDNFNLTIMRTVLKLRTLANDLPTHASQVLLDLEGGKFRVNVASEHLVMLDRSIRNLGFIIFFGLIGCGLTIGAFMSFAQLDRLILGVPVLGFLSLLLLGGVFLLALGWSFAGSRLRRIRLTKWLRRRR